MILQLIMLSSHLFFFKILFIYLRESVCVRAQAGVSEEGEDQEDSSLSREPNAGSIPGP